MTAVYISGEEAAVGDIVAFTAKVTALTGPDKYGNEGGAFIAVEGPDRIEMYLAKLGSVSLVSRAPDPAEALAEELFKVRFGWTSIHDNPTEGEHYRMLARAALAWTEENRAGQ